MDDERVLIAILNNPVGQFLIGVYLINQVHKLLVGGEASGDEHYRDKYHDLRLKYEVLKIKAAAKGIQLDEE